MDHVTATAVTPHRRTRPLGRGAVLSRFLASLAAVLAVLLLAPGALPAASAEESRADGCVDFADVKLWSTFPVKGSFTSRGVPITVRPFQWFGGTWTSGGHVRITPGGMAGGSGQELEINNASAHLVFSPPRAGLSVRFGEYGGNINVMVNGDFANVGNFADLHGTTLGGVALSVVNGFGNDRGVLYLHGVIDSLLIGGQELWIDDVCPRLCEKPVQFEDLALGATSPVGTAFASTGWTFKVTPFQWSDGTWYSRGYTRVGATGLPGGGGQDLMTNNVGVAADVGGGVDGLRVRFADEGGNVNLEVNGAFVNTADLSDVDGTVVGGVAVDVHRVPGTNRGVLQLSGKVLGFRLGGQQFFLDDVCFGRPLR